jgi:tRNA(adenine34) deaminase
MPSNAPSATTSSLTGISRSDHERFMRAAIEEGRRNPAWPFGAVIVDPAGGRILARGFNQSHKNITLHGEIVAFNNYVDAFGHEALSSRVLYTTAEPCPMCMGALIWGGVGGVVFGTSVPQLMRLGIRQITISAEEMCAQATFYEGWVMGGLLSEETDALFRDRLMPI